MGGLKSASSARIYQPKISLREISPMIWRRLLVSDEITLVELREVIQLAMGWEGYHLWRFTVNGREYGHAYGEGLTSEAHETILSDLNLRPRQKFLYEYDSGDCWQHEIRVEETLEPGPRKSYPRCIGGKRACPPEDCGGPWTYQELLHLANSPFGDHERRQAREILGRSFDPEVFDRRRVDALLKEIARR
ncbi:MAG: plasmid pRiA4b ORF-3 family protein [Actinomycetota bacterium]|nr:plasmid pRiA4b ORF-3 family protein [Actinomycetota bacterium]